MVRARRIPGVRPKKSLIANARRVIDVRLDELLEWRCALEEGSAPEELHAMRIAAKRLRYALEMFDLCFPGLKGSLRELTGIQEDLGSIHDLDVLTDLLRQRLQRMDDELEREVIDLMGSDLNAAAKSNGLRRLLYGAAREQRRMGLYGLIGSKVSERRRAYMAFQEAWGGDQLGRLAHDIREIVGLIPPDITIVPPDGLQAPEEELAAVSSSVGVEASISAPVS
jgi:hypothetical protein